MSYSQLIHLYPSEDRVEGGLEMSNSAGTALVLWMCLEKWLPPAGEYEYLLESGRAQMLWDLWKDERVPLHQRAVLMFTFDGAYVTKNNYSVLAKDIRATVVDFESDLRGRVNHWPEIATFLESTPTIPAIGLYATSVSDCEYYGIWNEDDEKYERYWDDFYDFYDALMPIKR